MLYNAIINELKQAESRTTFYGFLTSMPDQNGHLYHPKEEGVVQNFVGNVLDRKEDRILVEMRNLVSIGQALECFSYHQEPQAFTITAMWDEEGQVLEVANKPMSKVWIQCNVDARSGDFLRKKNT